jgi:HD superfamily phosphohydrolase
VIKSLKKHAESEGGHEMKIFRDPIHNVIDLDTGDNAVNQLIIKLIDSKEFQRLRRIKQLGFADFSYPNATHTRFAHSLGVAFLAKRYIDKLISIEEKTMNYCELFGELSRYKGEFAKFFAQIKRDKPLAIIAALLHDIGHGMLSHVFEVITGISHEKLTREIILGNSEINKILTKFSPDYPQIIHGILISSDEHSYTGKIINGTIDVDKMDYLLRDSHMTGSGYGKFDIEWLFNVLAVGINDGQIIIGLDEGKGLNVAEQLVIARNYMFRNVYLHKTSLVAEEMLKLLVERIKELPTMDWSRFFPNESMKRIFSLQEDDISTSLNLSDFLAISDEHYYFLLGQLQNSGDEVLMKLSSGLYNRVLYKEVGKMHWCSFMEYVREMKGFGLEKYYAFEINVSSAKEKMAYRTGKDEIFLFDKAGKAHELLTKSSIMFSDSLELDNHLSYYADSEIYGQYLIEMKSD